jgi:hypothetical protein
MSKAKQWRESLNLSVAELAKLSGYSAVTIWWAEQGLTPPRTAKHIAGKQKSGKIKPAVWQRYRNTCAGVEAQLRNGKQFNWGE